MKKGFGLIEFIISVNILLVVVIAAYFSFNLGLKTYKKIENQNYFNQNLRRASFLMSRDLRSAVDKKFIGQKEKVEFSTYSENVLYFVDSGLMRNKQSIAPLIKSLNFRYYDGINWYDSWNLEARNKLPRAVEIKFIIENEEFKTIVRLYSQE